MRCYCMNCNNFFEADPMVACPFCGTVGDELEECGDLCETIEDDEWDPTDEEIAYLYEQCEARRVVCNEVALIGVQ